MPRKIPLIPLLLLSCAAALAQSGARELITCGREKVLILDLDQRDAQGTPRILWTWQAAGRKDLPADYVPLFRSTDECKPIDGGRQILITSSTGGVALVDRAKNAVLFYGRAANAHSADVLPGGRIAVAASRDPRNHQGDALILFDVAHSGRELWRTELAAGHGVVWDAAREILWALADEEIRSYRLDEWKTSAPQLALVASVKLPEHGGHELSPVPGTAFLAITTSNRSWLFDRDNQTLSPHPTLAERSSIKCISVHPTNGQTAFTQADRPNWWTETIRFLSPEESFTMPGQQFYKVRWNVRSD